MTVPAAFGVTVVDVPVTIPIAGLMLMVSVRLFASVTDQISVTGAPATTVGAEAVKLLIVGALELVTLMVKDAVTGPAALLAVSVKTFAPVTSGVAFTFVPVTEPTCWLMLNEVAPATTQLSVTCDPKATV